MNHEPMHKSFIEKLNELRKLLEMRFPGANMQHLCEKIGKIAHHHCDKKKGMLLGETKELYNFLIEKGYNPFTVYRWLLIERLPEDIRFQIKQRRISQKQAISEAFKRRHETMQELGKNIIFVGLELIRRM